MRVLSVIVGLALSARSSLCQLSPGTSVGPWIWPAPQSISSSGSSVLGLNPSQFTFIPDDTTSQYTTIQNQLNRISKQVFPYNTDNDGTNVDGVLSGLNIYVSNPDISLDFNVDESYNLTIPSPSSSSMATLSSNTLWGAIWGLQTFSQLVEFVHTDNSYYRIRNAPLTIVDSPRFPWRGVMMDTTSHFIPVDRIKRFVDALSIQKMNVLHWHASDAEGAPLQSVVFPNLAKTASLSPYITYSPDDIKDIINYAADRAVRVVVEVSVPARTAALGRFNQTIIACPDRRNQPYPQNLGIGLNPISNATYSFLNDYLSDVLSDFADTYVHLGGDNIQATWDCLQSNPQVKNALISLNITSAAQAAQYFWKRLSDEVLPSALNAGAQTFQKIPVVFADSQWNIEYKNDIQKLNATYQVIDSLNTLKQIAGSSLRVINSAGWDLSRVASVNVSVALEDSWRDFYAVDPTQGVDASHSSFVLGGEALGWGTQIDQWNLYSTVFPRSSAVAERLWSPAAATQTADDVTTYRLQTLVCYLQRHGVWASSVGPLACDIPGEQHRWHKDTSSISINKVGFGVMLVLSVVGGLYLLALVIKNIADCRAQKTDNSVNNSGGGYSALQ